MHIATNSDLISLSTEKKTEELATKFLKIIKPGNIVFLYGDIGVGKTTFVKYLVNGLQKKYNLKTTEVTSPTFNLLNEYEINNIKINHYDLFRIKTNEDVKNLGLFEDITNSITLIEWPQIIKEKPKNLIELIFEYGKDHKKRYVKIKGLSL